MATRLQEVVEAFAAALNDITVSVALGRLKVAEHSKPRRVVFVSQGGQVGPPKLTTSGRYTGGQANRTTPLKTREHSVKLHITAENEESTEILFENCLRALNKALGNRATPGSYVEETEKPETAALMNWHPKITLDVTLDLLVLQETVPLTTMNGETHQSTFNGEAVDC
jgi:hypothetical protein